MNLARSAVFRRLFGFAVATALAFITACASTDRNPDVDYDLIIRNGTVYDGTGSEGFEADVAIAGDRIMKVGDLGDATAAEVIDADGLAVAPGFINVLSWATETLIVDGRSQSDIRQGVTLEIFGEGVSMGPLNPNMKEELVHLQGDIRFDVAWTTLNEYLEYLEEKGVSPNVASFVGATTVRVHELGYENRAPTDEELATMQELVRDAMRDGALGVGSSLIYAPAFYADTGELIALVATAAEYGGSYISHIRSEGDHYFQALDELIEIARATGAPAQAYHLKPAGEANWHKSETGLQKLTDARTDGLDISADIYTYPAGATGLNATMPPWVQEGGHDAWVARLKDPAIRKRVLEEMRAPADGWESLYQAAGGPDRVLFIGFQKDSLKPLIGKTLDEVAEIRGTSPEDTIIDLVIQDNSRVDTVYFLMSEENIRRNIAWPWTMFGSDEASYATEGVFLKNNAHPRAYGNFARLLGKYVREEQVIPLNEAIRRLTALPAQQFGIRGRGRLAGGYYADVVVFNPDTIRDHATFADPHQYSTGMSHVIVNGEVVLLDGEHTGALPGRVVRGPGWTGWSADE